jgi:diacylglycerol kinase
MKRFLKSFVYAYEGLEYTARTQFNFKVHLIGFFFMIFTSFYYSFTKIEFIICLILGFLVLILEILNTALECLVDLASPKFHILAKRAKDCAAGAVLLSAMLSVIVWIFIMYNKTL